MHESFRSMSLCPSYPPPITVVVPEVRAWKGSSGIRGTKRGIPHRIHTHLPSRLVAIPVALGAIRDLAGLLGIAESILPPTFPFYTAFGILKMCVRGESLTMLLDASGLISRKMPN